MAYVALNDYVIRMIFCLLFHTSDIFHCPTNDTSCLLFEIKEFKNEDPKKDQNSWHPEAWWVKFFAQTRYHPVRGRFSRFHFRLGQTRLYRPRRQVKIIMSVWTSVQNNIKNNIKRLELLKSEDLDFYKRANNKLSYARSFWMIGRK